MGIFGASRGSLPFLLHGLAFHAARQAFLVAAILTPVPLSLIDDAVPFFATRVRQVFPYRPLKEALTAFATANKTLLF